MKSTGIKPADAVIWSGGWTENRHQETSNPGIGSVKGNVADGTQRQNHSDTLSFSELVQQRWQGEKENAKTESSEANRFEDLLQLMGQSNEKIHETIRKKKSATLEFNTLPFAFEPSLSAAARFRISESDTIKNEQECTLKIPADSRPTGTYTNIPLK